MANIHAKSPCCRGTVYHRGGRRRSCSRCGRTWRIRLRKRGRTRRRVALPLLSQVLLGPQSLAGLARARRRSLPALRACFRRALDACTTPPRAVALFRAPLILLADALWFHFQGRRWTLSLAALRPVRAHVVAFLDPLLLPGKESGHAWRAVITAIPPSLRRRITALVTDGFRGAKGIAQEHGWTFQRRHFHLIVRLHAVRGRRQQRAGGTVREAVYQLVREALEPKGTRHLPSCVRRLRVLAAFSACPRRLRMIVHDFLRELPAFHAYLRYPNLHLPTTTNTVESMGRLIRAAVRPVRTPHALERWAKALVRLRPHVICNGKHRAPN